MIQSFINKVQFDLKSDRLGPDCPFTHWKLYFSAMGSSLMKKKFFYIGEGAQVRPGSYTVHCSKISLGDNVIIRPTSMLFADPRGNQPNIIIHNNAMLGSGVHIYVSNHSYECSNIPIIKQGNTPVEAVVIKEGAWVGANTIILPGVEIGEHSVIGAGSVVTKSIPEKCVAVGNPAKIIKYIEG